MLAAIFEMIFCEPCFYNRVYRAGDACVRLAGAGTEEYINRGNEAVAAKDVSTAQTQLRNLEIALAQSEANLLQAQAVLMVSAGKEPF